MLKVILYVAASLDGFIADKDGGVGWLDKYGKYGQDHCGYTDFYKSIDALVFGKNTYNQVLTFGDWPYPDKMSYIFGDKDMSIDKENVQLVQDEIPTFLQKIEKQGVERLWLMGGAQLVDSFDKIDCIDEYIIFYMPEKLGAGIMLPEKMVQATNKKLIDEYTYPESGIVRKRYTPN